MTRRTCFELAVVTIGLLLGSSSMLFAADPVGNWTWTVERNGNTFTNTLKLKQAADKSLSGTVTRNETETPIEDAKLDGDTISFKLTREINGNKMVFHYSGKVSDDEIVGETKVERDGETTTREWKAKKAK